MTTNSVTLCLKMSRQWASMDFRLRFQGPLQQIAVSVAQVLSCCHVIKLDLLEMKHVFRI